MATPRRQLVDSSVSGVYHCVSRCVRRAFLFGGAEGSAHRKAWIREYFEQATDVFAIQVLSFALMDNHIHLVIRTHPERVRRWSNVEVVRRWARLHERSVLQWADALRRRSPRAGTTTNRPPSLEEAIRIVAGRGKRIVRRLRRELSCISKFHQVVKHRVARRANREDGCGGHFWEARFSSHRALDDEAVLAFMVYVDLNPIRAGIAETPERSAHTSIIERIAVLEQTSLRAVHEASSGRDVPAARHAFLAPMDRAIHPDGVGDLTEREYVTIVDEIGRLVRPDKRGAIVRDLPPILVRLKHRIGAAVDRLAAGFVGTVLGGTAAVRRSEARRRGVTRVHGARLRPQPPPRHPAMG